MLQDHSLIYASPFPKNTNYYFKLITFCLSPVNRIVQAPTIKVFDPRQTCVQSNKHDILIINDEYQQSNLLNDN